MIVHDQINYSFCRDRMVRCKHTPEYYYRKKLEEVEEVIWRRNRELALTYPKVEDSIIVFNSYVCLFVFSSVLCDRARSL